MARLPLVAAGVLGRAVSDLGAGVQQVMAAVESTSRIVGRPAPPRLVAVSKAHSLEQVREAYRHGVRHFGENYVQELHCKATQSKDVMGSPGDIRWHFIGHLQRRHAKLLVEVPGLWMVETLDCPKTAQALSERWSQRKLRQQGGEDKPLHVMMQVNTSREESKSGCHPSACVDLAHYIVELCPHLKLCGLMVIGRPDCTSRPNPDFRMLLQCRELVQQTLKCADLELSMGMSDDYEHAIEMGSTNIRIGRAIFGPRV